MRTLLCKFTFPDGTKATASVSAETRYDRGVVEYTGAAARLGERFEETGLAVLRAWAQNTATRPGATLKLQETGQYDRAE